MHKANGYVGACGACVCLRAASPFPSPHLLLPALHSAPILLLGVGGIFGPGSCCSFDICAVGAGQLQTIDLSNSPDAASSAAGRAARTASPYPATATCAHPAQALTQDRDPTVGEVHGQGQLPQNGKIGSPVQQSASQRSGGHSSKTQASHAVTLSSGRGSAIDITGEVT